MVTATFQSSWVTLNVSKSGAGSGTVTSTPAGINCGADCVESYLRGTFVNLSSSAHTGSEFSGWAGGNCNDTGNCSFTINDETAIVATYIPIEYPVRIERTPGVNYSKIQDAYNAAIEGDVILVLDTVINETIDLNRSISITIEGGYRSDFSGVDGTTTLIGDIDINDANVSIENFAL